MYTLSEEYTGRAMQLRYHNTFSTINNKGTVSCHVRNGSEENILNKCTEILMIRVRTIQFHLCFQRYTISQPTFQTFINGITRRINIVIQELKNEIIARIGNRKVLCKDLV